jgi:tetraacyldisaccharide 4'-kinase
MSTLERAWYRPRRWLWLLWPLQALMRVLVACRRRAYRHGWLPSHRLPVPVIVIGNITVGGTGKTPLTAFVVQQLQTLGFKPGIVSRGYRSQPPFYPFSVSADTDVDLSGDEPLLLARQTKVPVVIDPDRVRGARALLELGCTIIVSDDGLQHYRLQRDLEIHVIDAARQLGNRWLLPAGPLREPPSRLQQIDLRVANGAATPVIGEHGMQLRSGDLLSLDRRRQRAVADWRGQRVHAVAGIGNPERFFRQLEQSGVVVERHPFGDHHRFQPADLPWTDAPIVMTEKDAVKCQQFDRDDLWYLPVTAHLSPAFVAALTTKINAIRRD